MGGSSTVAVRAMPGVFAGYRRAVLLAAVLGGLTLAGLSIVGQPLVGVFVCIGLGLGGWNGWRVQESVPGIVGQGALNVRAMSIGGLRRLGYVSGIAVVLSVAFRPVGWTVVIGLAVFQLLLVASTAGPLLREVQKG